MAKVRGNGTIYKMERDKSGSKCRKWQLRITVENEINEEDTYLVTKVVSGTYTDAVDAKRALIRDIEDGCVFRHAGMTFAPYADAWLAEQAALVAYNTLRKYRDHIKCAKIHLSDMKMEKIRPKTLEAMYKALRSGESPSGKCLSGTYVHDMSVTLNKMFKNAVRDEHVPTNPVEFARAPALDTEERIPIPLAQIRGLVEALDPRQPGPFVVRSSLHSGMRRAEIVALDIGDIDFQGKQVPVYEGVDSLGRLKCPKTQAGKRMLPMSESLEHDFRERISAIGEMFAETRERTGLAVPVVGPDTPLFCNEVGERMKPKIATRWWARNRDRVGFPDHTVHDMRHSYLTAMAKKKTDPKVLQVLAGHARYATTMDIYRHVDEEEKREAVALMDW